MTKYNNLQSNKRISELKKYSNIFLALVVFSSLYTLYIFHYTSSSHNTTQYTSSISYETFKYGLLKCGEIKRIKPDNNIQNRKTNPRYVPGTKNVLLKNARILDGIGGDFIGDLLLKDGIISEIFRFDEDENNEKIREKRRLNVTDDTVVIDLKKKYVTPGLIDMHRYLYN